MATIPGQWNTARGAENRVFRIAGCALAGTAAAVFAAFALVMALDPFDYPVETHLHVAVMTTWLGLFAVQALLATGGDIALHRRLGMAGGLLAICIAVSGSIVAVSAIAGERIPPIFSPGYFLVMTHMDLVAFTGLVAFALAQRRRSEWHKRLMLCALLALYEPVLGRVFLLLLVPALGGPQSALPLLAANTGAFEAARCLVHCALLAGLALWDWRATGRLHRAWLPGLLAIGSIYAVSALLGAQEAVSAFAVAIAGGV